MSHSQFMALLKAIATANRVTGAATPCTSWALGRRCYSASAIRRAASLWAVLPLASKALFAGVPAWHTVMVEDLRNRRNGREIWRL